MTEDRSHAERFKAYATKAKAQITPLIPEQRWRRWAGGGLVVLVLLSGASLLLRKRSIEAYITADVITITSPIDGVVTAESVNAGDLFQPEEIVIAVKASRDDATEIQDRQILSLIHI